jgi:hypothetical protein
LKTFDVLDLLMWAFCESVHLASQVGSVAMLLGGYLIGGIAWWLAASWWAAGQGICLGACLGCVTAAAVQADQ